MGGLFFFLPQQLQRAYFSFIRCSPDQPLSPDCAIFTHTYTVTLSSLDFALNDLHFVWLSLNSPAAPICQSSPIKESVREGYTLPDAHTHTDAEQPLLRLCGGQLPLDHQRSGVCFESFICRFVWNWRGQKARWSRVGDRDGEWGKRKIRGQGGRYQDSGCLLLFLWPELKLRSFLCSPSNGLWWANLHF